MDFMIGLGAGFVAGVFLHALLVHEYRVVVADVKAAFADVKAEILRIVADAKKVL